MRFITLAVLPALAMGAVVPRSEDANSEVLPPVVAEPEEAPEAMVPSVSEPAAPVVDPAVPDFLAKPEDNPDHGKTCEFQTCDAVFAQCFQKTEECNADGTAVDINISHLSGCKMDGGSLRCVLLHVPFS